MTIVGIVAEYNPFHLGHAHQIARTRALVGGDCAVVCAMSGDFVQRGEPAVFSKFARAEAAVRCGADLVVELPLPWCMASAESFARGAVDLLGGLGAEVLSFGSERSDPDSLRRVAQCLDSEAYQAELTRLLEEGQSFASCRQRAVARLLGEEDARVLSGPNDNLGVEYLRAIHRGGWKMEPLTIQRIGAQHDQDSGGDIRSASAIRRLLEQGASIEPFVPPAAYAVYCEEQRQGRGPVFLSDLELPILSRLRMLEEADFTDVPDAAEGLERKLHRACRTAPNLTALYDTVKSKRYAHARIRRMTLAAALGLKKQDLLQTPPYARILALNTRGMQVLRQAKTAGNARIISKPAAVRSLSPAAVEIFEKTSRAHDLYVFGWKNAGFHAGEADWKTSPRLICEQTIEIS